jgi:hypothetical protein
MQEDSSKAIQTWEGEIRERDLAEKRRVAPGWLDVGEAGRMLVPQTISSPPGQMQPLLPQNDDGGAAIDRAFGGLSMQDTRHLPKS